jgi:hypothetical protein
LRLLRLVVPLLVLLLLSLLMLPLKSRIHCNFLLPSTRRNVHSPNECSIIERSCVGCLQCHGSGWPHAEQLRITLYTQEMADTRTCKGMPATCKHAAAHAPDALNRPIGTRHCEILRAYARRRPIGRTHARAWLGADANRRPRGRMHAKAWVPSSLWAPSLSEPDAGGHAQSTAAMRTQARARNSRKNATAILAECLQDKIGRDAHPPRL